MVKKSTKASEAKSVAPGLTRKQIEDKLHDQKMRTFLWDGDKLIGIVTPRGTTIEFENAKVK